MEKWYSKYRRGDVWFLKLNNEDGDNNPNSSVQKKSRPFLIVSCEENNLNAPTLNVIPICTRDNDHLPMHVFYVYQDGTANGKNQTILCEQIMTVSTLDFDRKGSFFMYSLKLELMNQVDETLTRQLGLKPRVADMKVIERLIDELASKKEEEIKAAKEKEVNERVEKIVADIAKRFGIDINASATQNGTEYRDSELAYADKALVLKMHEAAKERKNVHLSERNNSMGVDIITSAAYRYAETENTIAEKNKTKIDTKIADVLDKPKSTKKSSKKKKKTNSTRNIWTIEKKKQFVEEYKTLSLSEMVDKYHLKPASVQQTAYAFKKDLAKYAK